jgi:hypothetical protein
MDDKTFNKYQNFILNIGSLLGSLSNEEITDILKEGGITDKQISDLTNSIIEISKIFYK